MYQIFIDDESNEWSAEMFVDLVDAVTYGKHRLRAHGAVRFDILNERGDLIMCNARVIGRDEAEVRDRIRRGW